MVHIYSRSKSDDDSNFTVEKRILASISTCKPGINDIGEILTLNETRSAHNANFIRYIYCSQEGKRKTMKRNRIKAQFHTQ
jgi:hypothetical protein